MTRSVPILLYHHVAPDREITPQGFEAQLRFLLEKGYRSIYLSELVRGMREKTLSDDRAFVLTFDDGYLDNWLYVFPILRKLSVKATMFLVTDCIEHHAVPRRLQEPFDTRTHEREPGGFISWSEAKEMAESGLVTLGSHTSTHRNFVRRDPYKNIENELRQSKVLIEKQLGRPCEHLAWPWGDYKSEWLPLMKTIGYHSAATTMAGANSAGSNPFELKRISVRRQGIDWLKSRLRWNGSTLTANAFGLFHGWDRHFKVWWNKESPYSHG